MVVVIISILAMPLLSAETPLQARRLDLLLPAELAGSREQLSRTRPRSRDVDECNVTLASNITVSTAFLSLPFTLLDVYTYKLIVHCILAIA